MERGRDRRGEPEGQVTAEGESLPPARQLEAAATEARDRRRRRHDSKEEDGGGGGGEHKRHKKHKSGQKEDGKHRYRGKH